MKSKVEELQTISSADLEKLTGLTDRQHRNISAQGYFPSPKNGQYQMIATIRGMFQYRKEEAEKKHGELAAAKLSREQDKARQERVAADTAEGSVVPMDVAKRAFVRFILAAKFKMLGMASRLAQKLSLTTDPITAGDILNTEVKAILTDLKSDLGKIECPFCKKEIKP